MLEAEFARDSVFTDVGASGKKRQVVLLGKFSDKLLVSVRFGATQLVIKMGDEENDAEFRAQFQQNAQQGDGVGSAGNGHSHAVACTEQLALANVLKHLVAHGMML